MEIKISLKITPLDRGYIMNVEASEEGLEHQQIGYSGSEDLIEMLAGKLGRILYDIDENEIHEPIKISIELPEIPGYTKPK